MKRKNQSKGGLEERIGHSALIRLKKLGQNLGLKCHFYAKCESSNPSGTLNDRIVLDLMNKALNDRLIKEGDNIVGSFHENLSLSIALASNHLGLKYTISTSQ